MPQCAGTESYLQSYGLVGVFSHSAGAAGELQDTQVQVETESLQRAAEGIKQQLKDLDEEENSVIDDDEAQLKLELQIIEAALDDIRPVNLLSRQDSRWASTHAMFDRALRLQNFIAAYFQKFDKSNKRNLTQV
jgi:predicted negative regulator of RcsB-dependent stress response